MATTNDNLKGLEEADGEWYLLGFKDNCIVGIDGGHGEIEGTAKALKLLKHIFGKEKHEGIVWRATYFMEVPDVDVPINDEAADACAMMVDRAGGKRGR